MINLNLNPGQIAFLIIVPVIIIVAVILLIYFINRRKQMKKNFKLFYYKKIYKIAMDKDYYLINDFLFKIDDSHVGRIDHILFADKYIFVMNDFFYDGNIIGKETDKSIIVVDKNGKKWYEENPLALNRKLISKLCLTTGINQALIVGICVINSNCEFSIKLSSKSYYIIQCNKLKALIKAIESREVGDINKDQLASAVKSIDKMNRRNRSGERK